ncbi:MAG: hypothetical protein KG003_08695 [Bacteroidetes bacterium]|nr:hypothetical protein [Bacteroidota bacterium]
MKIHLNSPYSFNGLFAISLIAFLQISCYREAKYPYQFAGTWKIENVEIKHYSDSGRTIDTVINMVNPGLMQLTNLTESYFENSNQLASFNFPENIPGSMYNFCGESGITNRKNFSVWYVAGPHGTERLSFWYELNIGNSIVIYTVKKLTRNKLELGFTETDKNGFLNKSEHWKCSITE